MAARAKRSQAAAAPEIAEELRREVAEQLARGGWSPEERLGLEQALDSLEGLRRDSAEQADAPPEDRSGTAGAEPEEPQRASGVQVDPSTAESAEAGIGLSERLTSKSRSTSTVWSAFTAIGGSGNTLIPDVEPLGIVRSKLRPSVSTTQASRTCRRI